MPTGRRRLQLRCARVSVCALAAFVSTALPQVSKAIKDEINDACKKPGSECQTTIIEAALGYRGSNARARLSLLKAKDPAKRVGAILSALGFSEQVNAGCREDGNPGGKLLDPETTGLQVTEQGHMGELGDVWKLGFDIYTIDWCNKSDFIQRNALVLTTAMDRIRAGRLPSGAAPLGGKDTFIVMGSSMGGLVARYALTSLEKNGPAHGADLFISFDSPQEGAYLPIGIQQAAEFFGDFTAAFVDDETLTQLRGADTPAARQMLLMHHDGANRSEPHADFKLLFTELDQLGYPRAPGLRTVAIANGGGSGKRSGSAMTPVLWEVGKFYDKTFSLKFPKDATGGFLDPIVWEGELRVKLEPVIDLAVYPHTQANVFQEVFRVAVQIPNPTINGYRIPITGFSVDNFLQALDLPEKVPADSFLKPIIQDINDVLEVFLNPFKLYQRTRLAKGPVGFDTVASGTSEKYTRFTDSLPGIGKASGGAKVDPFIPTSSALGLNRNQWLPDTDVGALAKKGQLESPFDQVYFHKKDTEHVQFTKNFHRWLCREVRDTVSLPNLQSIEPERRPVNGPVFSLVAKGAHFHNKVVIVWDNPSTGELVKLPTRFIDSRTLSADVPQALTDQLPPCAGGFCNLLFPEREPVKIYLEDPTSAQPDCKTELDFEIVDQSVTVEPPAPTTQSPIQLQLTGLWKDSCAPHVPANLGTGKPYSIAGNRITIPTTIEPLRPPGTPPNAQIFCTFAVTPYEVEVTVDPLPLGRYEVAFVIEGTTELGAQGFQVRYSTPEIVGLHPSSIPAGQIEDVAVTILGTGFVDKVSAVSWNGGRRPSKFVDENTLLISISPAEVASPGKIDFTVDNPDQFGANVSAPASIAITQLPLALASSNISTVQAGSPATTLILTGQSFTAGSVAVWTGRGGTTQNLQTRFLDSKQLSTVLPADQLTLAGTFLIMVRDAGVSTESLPISVEGIPPSATAPAVTHVTNAASFTTVISPGSFASIFGSFLSVETVSASTRPLPLEMEGVRVSVNGIDAALLYVSPTQINIQVPFSTASGSPARIVVVREGNPPVAFTVPVEVNGFGTFQYYRTPGVLEPIIVHADNQLVTPQNPARSGETVVVYGTGVGQIENAPADGAASPVNPPATCTVTPTVIVSSSALGASARTIYCGLTANFVSLIQINVQLPTVQSPEATWRLGIRFSDTGNFVFVPIHFAP